GDDLDPVPTDHLGQGEADKLRAFLLLDFIPADLRLFLGKELVKIEDPGIQAILSEPEVAEMMLG
ncbi:MAG: hypothetical protein R3350_08980, partial [Saprospiraceae bacterium]|nr:hypothetical protein [Saprospiraceae bacterium]